MGIRWTDRCEWDVCHWLVRVISTLLFRSPFLRRLWAISPGLLWIGRHRVEGWLHIGWTVSGFLWIWLMSILELHQKRFEDYIVKFWNPWWIMHCCNVVRNLFHPQTHQRHIEFHMLLLVSQTWDFLLPTERPALYIALSASILVLKFDKCLWMRRLCRACKLF